MNQLTFIDEVTNQTVVIKNDFMNHVYIDGKHAGPFRSVFSSKHVLYFDTAYMIDGIGIVHVAEEANNYIYQYQGAHVRDMNQLYSAN